MKRPYRGIGWPVIQSVADSRALALQFQFEQSQWWSPRRLQTLQLRQAQVVIKHAAATVPFYRQRLEDVADLPPGQLTMERFRQIPILTRNEIQIAGRRLFSEALPQSHGRGRLTKTSGSSGQPMEFLNTDVTAIMASALTMRGHIWHRRDLRAKNVTLRTPIDGADGRRRYRWSPTVHSGSNIVVDRRMPISQIFEQVVAEDPAYLQGHPFLMLGMIQHTEETGVGLERLREVRTYGETLDPWLRERCQAVWGVPMVDNYSAEECGMIAHQCPESTSFHVQSESVLVEILDNDGEPCEPGQSGRVIVTTLHNFASPMIREDLGDVAEVGGPCACGRGLPVLVRVVGRQRNFVLRPNGDKVFPGMLYGLFEIPAIRQWQLAQKTPEDIEVRLVVTQPLSAAEEARARQAINDRYGYPYNLTLTYVDDIPREASGKYQEFKSELLA